MDLSAEKSDMAALLAVVLVWQARKPVGTKIVIHFEQGYGLAPGDPLRLRGINVGEVESVKTTSDIYAPFPGEIIEVNEAVVANPAMLACK